MMEKIPAQKGKVKLIYAVLELRNDYKITYK